MLVEIFSRFMLIKDNLVGIDKKIPLLLNKNFFLLMLISVRKQF